MRDGLLIWAFLARRSAAVPLAGPGGAVAMGPIAPATSVTTFPETAPTERFRTIPCCASSVISNGESLDDCIPICKACLEAFVISRGDAMQTRNCRSIETNELCSRDGAPNISRVNKAAKQRGLSHAERRGKYRGPRPYETPPVVYCKNVVDIAKIEIE